MVVRAEQDGLKLGERVLQYLREINNLKTPDAVLAELHEISWRQCKLGVLGAVQTPLRYGDLDSLVLGQTAFLHSSAPKGWWEGFLEGSRQHPSIGYMMARLALAPFTEGDLLRMVEPLAIDRWSTELNLKYGIRDGLTCPVGGQWVVSYWSKKVLGDEFTPEIRAILFMAATIAAVRLHQITMPQSGRLSSPAALTARELTVLRLLSLGHRTRQIADMLELGEETVRTHLKKAQLKLGVSNRLHAVAQAIRLRLIS